MDISNQLKEARQRLGLSQSQAAREWEIPLVTLQKWEQGKHKPSRLALKEIQPFLAIIAEAKPTSASSASATSAPSVAPKGKRVPTAAAKAPKTVRPTKARGKTTSPGKSEA